ncbi:MAG: NYN domain-containing protein [Chloroflexales bacterium]
MSYENRRPDVAVFIDFENVYVSVRDKLNANPNFEAIMDRCSDLGRVVISRAYADWYRYPRVTSALYANAIEPIYVATYYYDKDMGRTGRAIKNSVDMNLCIDAMKTLFTNTNISKFVLVTGDRDFIPLVNSIRQQGKEVYVIGIGGAASTHLAQSADEFVFYEQLVGRQPGGSAAATAIANRSTELNRGVEVLYEHVSHAAPVYHAAPVAPHAPVVSVAPMPPATPAESDIYTVLVEAIHLVRKRGYVSTLGSIKLVMKELMGGDFKESRYKDMGGRPFAKFKDFVIDAEKRGKVQIFTNGTVNEVFLPGEDALKLSQFAAALTEEPAVEPVSDTVVSPTGRKDSRKPAPAPVAETPAAAAGRRRRRRSRRGQGGGTTAEISSVLDDVELESDNLLDLELTPPILDDEPMLSDPVAYMDELRAIDEREAITAIEVITEEQTEDELASAGMPADELLDELDEEFATPVAESEFVFELAPVSVQESDDLASAGMPARELIGELETNVAVAEESEFVAEDVEEIEDVVLAPIDFSDEEWAFFSTMMRGFSKPVSFQQIFDALRGLRKDQSLTRTNEQLRTMVKQAINNELLERSGRGKRVYYALKSEG